jgi:peptide/nickel transport system permease protein
MPIFWFGIVLQIVFYRSCSCCRSAAGSASSISSRRAPPAHMSSTRCSPATSTPSIRLDPSDPAGGALAAGSIAVVTRMMRASVIEVLDADHVRQARAKGLVERIVLGRHVFRNALIPTTTVIGLQVGTLLAGNVLTEVVFNWPGIGLYAVNAIRYLDYSAIMGVTLTVSIIYVFVNLLVDIAYVLLDPRISYGSASSPGR